MTDPRMPPLMQARIALAYEWRHKEPCPSWISWSAREGAEMERELAAWLPAFQRAGWFDANGDDLLLLCDDCVCADCGGRHGQHAPDGVCSCGCDPACDRFVRDSQLALIAEAVAAMVGSPMSEAVAHAVWHALNPDTKENGR